MDPTIQTAAQKSAESKADKMADIIMKQNAAVAAQLEACAAMLHSIGKPDLFQNRHYDWDDVLGLLAELAPTPNAEQALEFAREWGDRT